MICMYLHLHSHISFYVSLVTIVAMSQFYQFSHEATLLSANNYFLDEVQQATCRLLEPANVDCDIKSSYFYSFLQLRMNGIYHTKTKTKSSDVNKIEK